MKESKQASILLLFLLLILSACGDKTGREGDSTEGQSQESIEEISDSGDVVGDIDDPFPSLSDQIPNLGEKEKLMISTKTSTAPFSVHLSEDFDIQKEDSTFEGKPNIKLTIENKTDYVFDKVTFGHNITDYFGSFYYPKDNAPTVYYHLEPKEKIEVYVFDPREETFDVSSVKAKDVEINSIQGVLLLEGKKYSIYLNEADKELLSEIFSSGNYPEELVDSLSNTSFVQEIIDPEDCPLKFENLWLEIGEDRKSISLKNEGKYPISDIVFNYHGEDVFITYDIDRTELVKPNETILLKMSEVSSNPDYVFPDSLTITDIVPFSLDYTVYADQESFTVEYDLVIQGNRADERYDVRKSLMMK